MKRLLFSLALAALTLASAPAAADVVGPPPASCPDGSEPTSSHCGSRCSPRTCTTNADCAPGTGTCKALSLCAETSTCYNGWGGGTTTAVDVKGSCSASCAAPAVCQTLQVCASGNGSSSSSSGATTSSGGGPGSGETAFGGCGCRVGGGATSEVLAYGAIAGALILLGRRRRRG